MSSLTVLSNPSRRGFVSACAGCAAACLAKAPRAMAAPAPIGRKTRVSVVFTQAARDKQGWPYVNFDYESKQKEILAGLEAASSFAEFTTATATSAEDSKRILEAGRDADGFLVFLLGIPSGGAGREIAFSGRPAVVVDHLYGGTGEFLGSYGPARKKGLPVAGVASSRFSDVIQALRALDTVQRAKDARILDVTKRDPSRLTAEIKTAYGADVIKVSGDELSAYYDKASPDEGRQWAQTWIKGAGKVVEPSREEIAQCGRMYVAMKNMLDQQRSRVITVDCLDLFYANQLRSYPCLGFFQLNNDCNVGACEADLTSTSTMLLMTNLTGQPGYISDPVLDTATNQIIYAHCVAPNKVWGPGKPANEYHIRSHSEDRKGAAVRSLLPLGVMTTSLEFLPGRREVIMHQAKTVANVDEDKACRTKLAATPRDAAKLAEDWQAGWHRVTYFGDHRMAVDALAALLKFKVTIEG
jgi:hypothetical protein